MTTQPTRPFGLVLAHRPIGVRLTGSTWYLQTSPACPVVVVAAILARYRLSIEQAPDGRLAMYSQANGATPPDLDDVGAYALSTLRQQQALAAAAQRAVLPPNVIRFPRRERSAPC
jgi:hypothetical protein